MSLAGESGVAGYLRSMLRRGVLALILAFAAVPLESAVACSLVPSGASDAKVVRNADAAIYGRVLSIGERKANAGDYAVRFRVYRLYRGRTRAVIRLVTVKEESACGLFMKVGEKFGLVLYKPKPWRVTLGSPMSLCRLNRATGGRFRRP